jgi:hypothetical protein
MKTLFALILTLPVCFIGCTTSEVQTVDELNRYIQEPDNDLVQQAEINDYKISVTYRPTDLLVYQDIGNPTESFAISWLGNRADIEQTRKDQLHAYLNGTASH